MAVIFKNCLVCYGESMERVTMGKCGENKKRMPNVYQQRHKEWDEDGKLMGFRQIKWTIRNEPDEDRVRCVQGYEVPGCISIWK
jgi:hypothetical protein